MRSIVLIVWGVCCSLNGCAFFEYMGDFAKPFKPRAYDSAEEEAEFSGKKRDNWESVGREARSDRPLEKDPDILQSDKARMINRSLGTDSSW